MKTVLFCACWRGRGSGWCCYVLGYLITRVAGLPVPGRRAVSIEVGMQNSGLAAALATVHFSPAAALPAAIFSVWHNVSGSALASYWSRRGVSDRPAADDAEAQQGAEQ